MLNARMVHETAMPEASRTDQLLYQQTQGGVLSYPFSLPAGIAGTTSELVFCLTTYDRGLKPLAALASHVCVMKTTVMHDRRLLYSLTPSPAEGPARVEPGVPTAK